MLLMDKLCKKKKKKTAYLDFTELLRDWKRKGKWFVHTCSVVAPCVTWFLALGSGYGDSV